MTTESFIRNHLTDSKIKQTLESTKWVGKENIAFKRALERELEWREANGKHFTDAMKMQHTNWQHEAIMQAVQENRPFEWKTFPRWFEVENWDTPPAILNHQGRGRVFVHDGDGTVSVTYEGFDQDVQSAELFAITLDGVEVWALDNTGPALEELKRLYSSSSSSSSSSLVTQNTVFILAKKL